MKEHAENLDGAVGSQQISPSRLQRMVRRALRHDEDGASLVEYALLIALIAVVCVAAITQFGGSNGSGIDRSADSIVNAGS
jgi:Flp pilus assembly pilin Flp